MMGSARAVLVVELGMKVAADRVLLGDNEDRFPLAEGPGILQRDPPSECGPWSSHPLRLRASSFSIKLAPRSAKWHIKHWDLQRSLHTFRQPKVTEKASLTPKPRAHLHLEPDSRSCIKYSNTGWRILDIENFSSFPFAFCCVGAALYRRR
ncbi:hypothetical protein chiPu_0013478 [Chiloscyllium punctatum]|uniref:Uncharacterized protein n=1 Tax=Chiloscyllium punctatum TaxID=137246 RepID=A0A401SXA5_CHIPU|nr:hypothetical protein [Chiloscyllium punctatum]